MAMRQGLKSILNIVSKRFLLYFGILVFASYADSKVFKVGDVLDLHSRLLVARVLGADYPEKVLPVQQPDGRVVCQGAAENCSISVANSSAVVLFDDRTLENLQTAWPAPYSAHALVLSRILEQKPRAVFVDLIFVDKRPDFTLRRLTKVIEEYGEQGIPLIFAAPPRDIRRPLLPEIRQALGREPGNSLVSVVLATSQTGKEQAATRFLADETVSVPESGQLSVLAEYASALAYPEPENEIGCELWPAAFYLAVIFRNGSKALQKDCTPDTYERHQLLKFQSTGVDVNAPRQFVELRWKGKPGVGVRDLWRCDDPEVFFEDEHLRRFERTFNAWTGERAFKEQCPPIASVRAIELLKRDADADSRPGSCDQSVVDCLTGRVVFYGADIAAADDRVETPISGRIPGVYVHAMAFDNVLTFDLFEPRNQRQYENQTKFKKYLDFLLICIFCFLGLLISRFLKDVMKLRKILDSLEESGKISLGIVRLSFAIMYASVLSFAFSIILIFLMKILYLDLGLPPFNLLGLQIMVGTTILFDTLEIGDIFFDKYQSN